MDERQWTVGGADGGMRLDRFLADAGRLGSRSKAADALDRGKVFVNDAEAQTQDARRRLIAGDTVRVWIDRPGSGRAVRPRRRRDGDLVIVYEDPSLLVVDKPAGLLAVPLPGRSGQSLVDLVIAHLRSQGRRTPQVVHRIDRDTTGLVLFAKDGATTAHLKQQFLRRSPERVYLAVVHGVPEPPNGTWRDRLVWDHQALVQRVAASGDAHGRDAISRYRVVRPLGGASLLEVSLVTGKRNQIRVQAALRSHPLVGERQYNTVPEHGRIPFPRQALHAHRLAFEHPATGRRIECSSPMPEDMAGLVGRLSGRTPAA